MSDRRHLSDKIMVRWNRNVQWSDSIGQNHGAVRQKCPIEGFYRTKSCCGQAEMSDRELLSDKIMVRWNRNVQLRASNGQNHVAVRQKCPIESFYRTKSWSGGAEMSNKELLSDKIMLRSGRNVQ
jgi:hypothetical protein